VDFLLELDSSLGRHKNVLATTTASTRMLHVHK
jgi:hypothetical protein